MKTFLLYLFQISFWIAQLAIIAFVFSYLETRIELIVVSILGLLYTAVRGEALFSSYARVHYAIASHKDLTRILELIGERHEIIEERRKEAEKADDKWFSALTAQGPIQCTWCRVGGPHSCVHSISNFDLLIAFCNRDAIGWSDPGQGPPKGRKEKSLLAFYRPAHIDPITNNYTPPPGGPFTNISAT